MHPLKRASKQHITAWTTLAMMLLALLAPAVSHALAKRQADAVAWAEVCTGTGVRPSAPRGQMPETDQDLQHALTHCPLCAMGLDKLAPPTTALSWTAPCRAQALRASPAPRAVAWAPPWRQPVRGPPIAIWLSFLV